MYNCASVFSRQQRDGLLKLYIEYETAEKLGFGYGFRIHEALQDAIDIHSPVGESPDFVNPNTIHWIAQAKEAEIRALPHAEEAVGDAIAAFKPLDSLDGLLELLRRTGLPLTKAVELRDAASDASDEWNKTRI